jgi:hypothetical protein
MRISTESTQPPVAPAIRPTEQQPDRHHRQRREPTRAHAEQHARKDVAADAVAAEQEPALPRRLQRQADGDQRIVRHQQRHRDRDCRHHEDQREAEPVDHRGT